MSDPKGQVDKAKALKTQDKGADLDHFVLEKSIFAHIFEKDIRRVYIYKKAERLAKAIHMVAPAFTSSPALKDRIVGISVCLVDGAVCTPAQAKEMLSRELLALSSVLSIARASGMLSPMNADIIAKEARHLLEEVAGYEEPHLTLEEHPNFSRIAKSSTGKSVPAPRKPVEIKDTASRPIGQSKGQSAREGNGSRKEAIVSVLKSRGPSYIKDISSVIRNVSEKTIQRELQVLISEGTVSKTGDRRWTTYRLVASS